MWRSDSRTKNAPQGRFSLDDMLPGLAAALFSFGWLTTSHISPWVSWHAEFPFFIAAFGLAWTVVFSSMRREGTTLLVLPPATWPLLVLGVCTVIQFFLGQLAFVGAAIAALLYLLLALICICTGMATDGTTLRHATLSTSPLQVDIWLAGALLSVGVLSVGIGLVQVLQVFDDATWVLRTTNYRRAAGNVGQPNHLATLLVMGVASSVYLHSTGRLGRSVMVLCIGFILLGLVATGSRSGVLGLTLLLLWWLWKQPAVTPGLARWRVLPVVIGFLALYFLWPKFLALYDIAGQSGLTRITKSAADSRLIIWPQLLEAIGQRPWFGWGVRNTAEAHAAVVHGYDRSLPLTYSHNLLIDLAIWVGLPLAALLTMAALYWLWWRARAIDGPKAWFGLAVALPLGMHSMLEFPFAYAYLLAPAMVGIGIVEGAARSSRSMTVDVRPAIALLAILTCLAAWSVIEYLRAEEDFQLGRFEMLRIGPEGQADDPTKLFLLTQLRAVNEAARLKPRPSMLPEEMETLRSVADHYAWSGARYRYATALALNGETAEALRQMHILRVQHGDELYGKLKKQLDAEVAIYAQTKGPASN